MEDRLTIKLKMSREKVRDAIFLFFVVLTLIEEKVNAQQNVVLDKSKNTGVSASYDELLVSSTGNLINNGEMFVYNDLSNEGEISFETESSIFNFKGQVPQKVTGRGNSLFSNVLFDNASEKAPFSIEKNILIKGNVDFSDGIISYSNDGLMIFDESAAALNVSEESFVVDKVRKRGKQEFVFPIGDNRESNYVYRKLRMEAPSISSSVVDAQYLWEDPGNLYSTNLKEDRIEIVDNQEYWVVDDFNGQNLPDLTFYWDAFTTPSSILTSNFVDRIIVVRWNDSKWIKEEIIEVDKSNFSIKIRPSGDGVFTFALLKKVLPDYSPTLLTKKTQINGSEGAIDFVILIAESNEENANGVNPVEVRIPDSKRFRFSFNDQLTSLNGYELNNFNWIYKLENGLHKFTYKNIFIGKSEEKIGVNAIFISPENSKGEVPLKVTIKADSGGQENRGNDNDQDIIKYSNKK